MQVTSVVTTACHTTGTHIDVQLGKSIQLSDRLADEKKEDAGIYSRAARIHLLSSAGLQQDL